MQLRGSPNLLASMPHGDTGYPHVFRMYHSRFFSLEHWGIFFECFGFGNNALSICCASVFLWILVFLILRGMKEATAVNTIVTLAKFIPLVLFVVAISLLGKFDPNVFFSNFWGEPGGPSLGEQISSTMIALVWVFTGIEGAVVIAGRAKFSKDVGRATVTGFLLVFWILLRYFVA